MTTSVSSVIRTINGSADVAVSQLSASHESQVINLKFNLKLKSAILQRYPSQIAFAVDLGVSESTISKIVRGWRHPKEELRKTICQKLGIKEDEIFCN